MPLRETPLSLESYYSRQRQATQQLNIEQERDLRRARAKREAKEKKKEAEEEAIRKGRVRAEVAGIDVEEPRGRLDGRFRTTYAPTERRERTISAYETALGKEARPEERRKPLTQKDYEAEIKGRVSAIVGPKPNIKDYPYRPDHMEAVKEWEEEQERVTKEERQRLGMDFEKRGKTEKSLIYFAKRWMGKTFNKGTDNEYTLDTPEEYLYRYKKQVGTPSQEMRDAVMKLDWPAGGVVETGRAKEPKEKAPTWRQQQKRQAIKSGILRGQVVIGKEFGEPEEFPVKTRVDALRAIELAGYDASETYWQDALGKYPAPKIGEIIEKGGKKYKVTGIDKDGVPLVDLVK